MKLSEAIAALEARIDYMQSICEWAEANGIAFALDTLESVTDWEN